ncbi:MAG: phosphatase PAP2 family protein [Bacteroidota bacterium]
MLETLLSFDRSLFLFLNGLHCPFFDPVMYYGTWTVTWIPLFLFFLYAIIRRYKWQSLWIILFAALMVAASDQLSNLVKDWVARPRPTHQPGLEGIHTVAGYTGGPYGFYSAHASTSMAIAIFLVRMLMGRYRYFTVLILFWAFFRAYTRIYLGVHYPLDLVAGWAAGGALGWGFGLACSRVVLYRSSPGTGV